MMLFIYKKALESLRSQGLIEDIYFERRQFLNSVLYLYVTKLTIPQSIFVKGYSVVSQKKALQRLLGEILERTSFARFSPELELKKSTELTGCIEPSAYMGCFGEPKIAQSIQYDWVTAKNVDGKMVYIPFQPHTLNVKQLRGQQLRPASSAGCAVGISEHVAVLFGIYELLERDAYAKAILGSFTLGNVYFDSLPKSIVSACVGMLDYFGLELHISVLPTRSGISSVSIAASVLDHQNQWGVMGLKSHMNPYVAIQGAIEEAISTYVSNLAAPQTSVAKRKMQTAYESLPRTPFLMPKKFVSYSELHAQKVNTVHNMYADIVKQLRAEKIRLQYFENTVYKAPGFVSVVVDTPDLIQSAAYRYDTPDVLRYVSAEKKKLLGVSEVDEVQFSSLDPFF